MAAHAATYVVLPNVVFAVLALATPIERAPINLDYVLVGLIAMRWPAPALRTLFLATSLIDLVASYAPVYHFRIATAMVSLRYVEALALGNSRVVVPLAAAALGGLLGLAWLVRPVRRDLVRPLRRVLLVLAVGIGLGDALVGRGVLDVQEFGVRTMNVATSAVFRTLQDGWATLHMRSERHPETAPVASAAANSGFRSWLADSARSSDNALVILVESLGRATRAEVDSAQLRTLLTPAVRASYEVRTGDIPFSGMTTSAELRELCGVLADHVSLPADSAAINCLPHLAKLRHMSVLGLHGFVSTFFDRERWYPKVGLDHVLFGDAFLRRGARRCGGLLVGVCDDEVAAVIRDSLRARSGWLIYWLTLSSHLEMSAIGGASGDYDCTADADAATYPDVCALRRALASLMSDVAGIALAPGISLPRILLVGDHAPPFIQTSKRGFYSPNRVPYVYLVPRLVRPSHR